MGFAQKSMDSDIKGLVDARFSFVNERIKKSFVIIKEEMNQMKDVVRGIHEEVKNQKERSAYARKEDNKVRETFRREVDAFKEDTKQVKKLVGEVREVREKVVLRRDLSDIEEKMRDGLRAKLRESQKEIGELRRYVQSLEKKIAHSDKERQKELKRYEKERVRKEKKSTGSLQIKNLDVEKKNNKGWFDDIADEKKKRKWSFFVSDSEASNF